MSPLNPPKCKHCKDWGTLANGKRCRHCKEIPGRGITKPCACDWDYAQGCPAYLGDEGGICETLHPIHYTIIEDQP